MPGFLDTLTRDETILVLFSIAFVIAITGAAIGGLICILSGADNKSPKKHKRSSKHRRRLGGGSRGEYYHDYHER